MRALRVLAVRALVRAAMWLETLADACWDSATTLTTRLAASQSAPPPANTEH